VTRIGLMDLDRTGFPNLALMKLSAWHRAQGHEVELIRDDPSPLTVLYRFDKVHASAVFSWNRAKALAWEAIGVEIGGSGVSLARRLPPEIEALRPDYSLYGIDYGFGFLSRGCIRKCSFCIVPQKDGLPRVVASIDDLLNHDSRRSRPFVVLLDDEFFWNLKWAIAQLEEFTRRGIDWCPSQGLDIRCTAPALCEALAASPFWNVHRTRRQITFAFDDVGIERRYRQGVEQLFAAGIKAWQLQSYVLVGFDTSTKTPRPLHADDHRRIAVIQEYGIDPFVMVYREPGSGRMSPDRELRDFARWVNGRICKTCAFEEYRRSYRRTN
jgi:hypothetical protein